MPIYEYHCPTNGQTIEVYPASTTAYEDAMVQFLALDESATV